MAHLGKRKVSGRQGARDLQDGMSSDDEDLEVGLYMLEMSSCTLLLE
jgi:hypothetical protein